MISPTGLTLKTPCVPVVHEQRVWQLRALIGQAYSARRL